MTEPDLLARAEALHRRCPVVECHTDVPINVYRRRRAGEAAPYRNDWVPRLRAGGVNVQLLAVGGDVPGAHERSGDAYLTARDMIDDVLAEEGDSGAFRVVRAVPDLDAAVADDRLAFVLHLEGLRPVVGEYADGAGHARPLHDLQELYDLGVRSAGLTWNGRNAAADGVGVDDPGGLTPLGRDVVPELERLGVLIDVSHLAEPGFWDLVETVRGPIVATHANTKALCPHPRNLTDDQLRAVAASGGFVGVCFIGDFIGEEPSLERLLDHVDHIAEVIGIDAVAIGPDYVEFDAELMGTGGDAHLGPEGLRRVETLPVFTAGLLGRGYSEADAAAVVGGNALRVLRAILPRS